jgi:hypothetical protein
LRRLVVDLGELEACNRGLVTTIAEAEAIDEDFGLSKRRYESWREFVLKSENLLRQVEMFFEATRRDCDNNSNNNNNNGRQGPIANSRESVKDELEALRNATRIATEWRERNEIEFAFLKVDDKYRSDFINI